MFLALQVLLLLAGAGICVFSVRLGFVVWLALALQFVSFMWMTLPVPQFALQALVFGGAALVAGFAAASIRGRLPWFAVPATHLAVLGVLRFAMMLYWWAGAPISRVSWQWLRLSTAVLLVPTTIAFLVAHLVAGFRQRKTAH